MVLAVCPAAAGTRSEVVVEQMALVGDLVAVLFALGGSEVVVEKVVCDAHAVEQMACGEVYVRLAEAVAPDVVAYGRVHITLCSCQILWVSLHLVGERGFSDREGDVVLSASRLRGRRRRRSLKTHADAAVAAATTPCPHRGRVHAVCRVPSA